MDELIARLEKATGPDRELDWAIFDLIERWPVVGGDPEWRRTPSGTTAHVDNYAPSYTASIDAALLLLGDLDWEIKTAPHRKGGIARIVSMERTIWAEAATPVIALCIAALKART